MARLRDSTRNKRINGMRSAPIASTGPSVELTSNPTGKSARKAQPKVQDGEPPTASNVLQTSCKKMLSSNTSGCRITRSRSCMPAPSMATTAETTKAKRTATCISSMRSISTITSTQASKVAPVPSMSPLKTRSAKAKSAVAASTCTDKEDQVKTRLGKRHTPPAQITEDAKERKAKRAKHAKAEVQDSSRDMPAAATTPTKQQQVRDLSDKPTALHRRSRRKSVIAALQHAAAEPATAARAVAAAAAVQAPATPDRSAHTARLSCEESCSGDEGNDMQEPLPTAALFPHESAAMDPAAAPAAVAPVSAPATVTAPAPALAAPPAPASAPALAAPAPPAAVSASAPAPAAPTSAASAQACKHGAYPLAITAIPTKNPSQVAAPDSSQNPDPSIGTSDMAEASITESTVIFDPTNQEQIQLVHRLLSTSNRQLPAAGVPEGRQQQADKLLGILQSCCMQGKGRSIYISGLPGTGKSYTVAHAIKSLATGAPTSPYVITLNCMSLTDTGKVYQALLKECYQAVHGTLDGCSPAVVPSVTSAAACHDALLELLHSSGSQATKKSKVTGAAGSRMFVMVLDEVDRLLSGGLDNMYKLFMLPHLPGVSCSFVAVANSLDLTERLLPMLKYRGCPPELICFPAYSKTQVNNILIKLVEQLPWKVFDAKSIELVARSVANSSGDLRQALKACRKALDLLAERHRSTTTQPPTCAAAKSHQPCTNSRPTVSNGSLICSNPTITANRPAPQAEQPPTTSTTNPQPQQPPCMADGSTNSGPATVVTVQEMMQALAILSGKDTKATVSAVATIQKLPAQQQLVLLATAITVAAAAAAAAAARQRREAEHDPACLSYTKLNSAIKVHHQLPPPLKQLQRGQQPVNPFQPTAAAADQQVFSSTSTSTSSASGGRGSSSGSSGAVNQTADKAPGALLGQRLQLLAGDSAMQVAIQDVYEQYTALCKLMFMASVSLPAFKEICQLIAEQGLLLIGKCGPGSGRGAPAAAAVARVSLKVLAKDVHVAMKSNVLFKKIMGV